MILISNRQRDDIVRYLEFMCERMRDTDLSAVNAKRVAGTLAKKLRSKQKM
jgi:hypothetical protein